MFIWADRRRADRLLRADELHFPLAETSSFLIEAMHLPLTEEDVTTLQERTEGWIAGLQLAALSVFPLSITLRG